MTREEEKAFSHAACKSLWRCVMSALGLLTRDFDSRESPTAELIGSGGK